MDPFKPLDVIGDSIGRWVISTIGYLILMIVVGGACWAFFAGLVFALLG